MGIPKEVKELFKKFYNMEPYLFIDEKEWKYILDTYEKDDVVDELSKFTHISMSDTRDYRERITR